MDGVTEIDDWESRKRQNSSKKMMNLLDMPDFALDRIVELLPPLVLCRLAAVCKELRVRCTRDELWEKFLKQKWGKLIDHVAYVKWQCFITCVQKLTILKEQRNKEKSPSSSSSSSTSSSGKWQRYVAGVKNLACLKEIGKRKKEGVHQTSLKAENDPTQLWTLSSIRSLTLGVFTPNDSIMAFYFAIENGQFWFPAQVYNHQLCYDVEACYDSRTNTFKSRFSPYGSGRIEAYIPWERIRAPPVDTPPNEVHKTECLDDLKPDDHIEIQWKQSQNSPYDWWYAVVGHLDSCDGNRNHCHCQNSDMIMVEFRQYSLGTPWRRAQLYKSGGLRNQNYLGKYGGIRKLYDGEEIALWKSICRHVS